MRKFAGNGNIYSIILGLLMSTVLCTAKVLILVDEVGTIAIADLAKTLAQPVGLVTKWVRQYAKLGVLKKKGDKAVSLLRELKIKEGEVKVDE